MLLRFPTEPLFLFCLDYLLYISEDWLSYEEIKVWLKVTTFLLVDDIEFLCPAIWFLPFYLASFFLVLI